MTTINHQLVSVIMPAYNCAAYIEEAIQSVLAQSYSYWELLVVDDCSSDQTVALVQRLQQQDTRIRLLQNTTNLGGAGARNRAIEQAKGRYIAFLDADDFWLPTKLEIQIKAMQQHHYAFMFSAYRLVGEQGECLGHVDVPRRVDYAMLLKHNYIGCLTAIYDTGQLGKIFMPVVRKRQDFALWLQVLKRADAAYGINEPLACYRIRAGSLSGNKKDAFSYYWKVLREVEGLSWLRSAYSIGWYLFIVACKKKWPGIYNYLFIRTSWKKQLKPK